MSTTTTSDAILRPARGNDLPAIEHLLVEAGLPLEGVSASLDTFTVADEGPLAVGEGSGAGRMPEPETIFAQALGGNVPAWRDVLTAYALELRRSGAVATLYLKVWRALPQPESTSVPSARQTSGAASRRPRRLWRS